MIQFDKPLLWIKLQTKDLFLEQYYLFCDHEIDGIIGFLDKSFTPTIMGICITYTLTAIAIFFAFVIIKYQPLFQYYGETVANWYLQEMKPVHYLKSGLLLIAVLFVSYMVYTGVGDEHGVISLIMFCTFIIVLVLFTCSFVKKITLVLKDNYLENNISKLYERITGKCSHHDKNENHLTDELERLIETSIVNNNVPMIEKLLEGYKNFIETKLSEDKGLTSKEKLLYMFLNNINKSSDPYKLIKILANYLVMLVKIQLEHQETRFDSFLIDFSKLIRKCKEVNATLIPYRQAVLIFSSVFSYCNENPANDGKYLILKLYFRTIIDGILSYGHKEEKRNFFYELFHEFTETMHKNIRTDLCSEFENSLYKDTLIGRTNANRLLEIIRYGYWDVLEDLGSLKEKNEQIDMLNRFIQHINNKKETITTEEYCKILHPMVMDIFYRFWLLNMKIDLFEIATFKLILEYYIEKSPNAKIEILTYPSYKLILDYLKIEL